MKILTATAVLVFCAAGFASAQDDSERKVEELRRAMKTLQQKFDAERARIEKELHAAQERLLEKKEDGKPRDLESLVRELIKRVDSLEKKLDGSLPPLRELPRLMPRDFDFKRFDGMPDEWRRWLEQMPRFKGGEDFKFEFRKPEKKDEDKREEKKEKPKKKENSDD
jgi:hypothetical protein